MTAEIVPMFTGEPVTAGSTSVTPATFIKKFRAHMRDLLIPINAVGDAARIDALKDYLVEDSPAETWYKDLQAGAGALTTWAAMEAAFLVRFPGPEKAGRTKQEWERELVAMRLSLAELGTTVQIGGADVFAHVHFASRLLEVAKLAGIAATISGIWQSRDTLPEVIRDKVPSTQASWTTYTAAIKAVDRDHIREGVAKARKAQDLERTVTELKARSPPLTPVSKMSAQMSRTVIATPRAATAPVPARAAAAADTFGGGGGGGQGNLFTPPETLSDVGKRHLRKIVEGLAGAMLQDDQGGRTEYTRRIGGWHTVHGNKKVLLERTGFPLSPGTAPPLSGECFVCGKVTIPWHARDSCPGPRIPIKEKIFRGLCVKYLRDDPVAINAVFDDLDWMDFVPGGANEEDFGEGLSE
ncbi:hypothetical protein C8R43DRAFT_902586 [Mycena crocata]|nr:hypothetical protein C8R43DRAFT_902586 [Mycena crocata]